MTSNSYGSSAAAMRADLGLGQRDQVRVAVHEADVAAVRDDLHDVAGQQRAAPVGAAGPVQDGAAGEVPAAADQRQPVRRGSSVSPSQNSIAGSGRMTHSRSSACSRTGHVEAVRPLDHRRVVVRVRDGDRGRGRRSSSTAATAGVVEQRDAVPQTRSAVAGHQQRALADRERAARCRSR